MAGLTQGFACLCAINTPSKMQTWALSFSLRPSNNSISDGKAVPQRKIVKTYITCSERTQLQQANHWDHKTEGLETVLKTSRHSVEYHIFLLQRWESRDSCISLQNESTTSTDHAVLVGPQPSPLQKSPGRKLSQVTHNLNESTPSKDILCISGSSNWKYLFLLFVQGNHMKSIIFQKEKVCPFVRKESQKHFWKNAVHFLSLPFSKEQAQLNLSRKHWSCSKLQACTEST